MGKWLVPVVLTGGIAVLLWLLLGSGSGIKRTATGAGGGAIDPNAAAATGLCTAGVAYFGGMTAGMAGMPVCAAAGPAFAPIVKSAVGATAGAIDDVGDVVHSVLRLHSGAAEIGLDIGKKAVGSVEDVVHDTYGATKDVVHAGGVVAGDIYSATKDIVLAPVTVAKKVGSWIGGLF